MIVRSPSCRHGQVKPFATQTFNTNEVDVIFPPRILTGLAGMAVPCIE